MVPFDSLGGHYSLQTVSEIRSDLRFEISDLNYLPIHAHIAYMIWTLGSEIEIDITKTPGRFCCVSWLMGTIYVGFTHLRGSVICSHPIGCVIAIQKKQLQLHIFASSCFPVTACLGQPICPAAVVPVD